MLQSRCFAVLSCGLGLCLSTFFCSPVVAAPAVGDKWSRVVQGLQSPTMTVPAVASTEGAPVRDGGGVVFRFRAPQGAAKVYLAGTFNGFAANNNGIVSDERFAMTPIGNGVWFKKISIEPQTEKYKFVVVTGDGKFNWQSDPFVQQMDGDGNSIFDFASLFRGQENQTNNWRPLKPFQSVFPTPQGDKSLRVRAQKVWTRPDETNSLVVPLIRSQVTPRTNLELNVLTPLGRSVCRTAITARVGDNFITVPGLKREGGFVAQIVLSKAGRVRAWGEATLSVATNIADDLRYGFYASYGKLGQNYGAKAEMLADLGVNAVEFYDYFPAHGYYAPRQADYQFEPFGVAINARDIERKIETGHEHNILSLAYVASYAASESVYRAHPYPMTDAAGSPKVFNGSIMSETQADQEKKPKWFYLMNIAPDSPWHKFILEEFGRTLDASPNDLVSFDGFELDTYGDSPDAKFYAPGSARNGDLLTNVLHDFVGDVQKETHGIKPHGEKGLQSTPE